MSRVRMPHNNRVNASAALRTNDMWSKTIGHDPYAASNEAHAMDQSASEEQAASLMLLAKMSNLSGVESRGGCTRCGMLGHLTFQCRNAPIANKGGPGSAQCASYSSSDSSSESESESESRHEMEKSVNNTTQNIVADTHAGTALAQSLTDRERKRRRETSDRHSEAADKSKRKRSSRSTHNKHGEKNDRKKKKKSRRHEEREAKKASKKEKSAKIKTFSKPER